MNKTNLLFFVSNVAIMAHLVAYPPRNPWEMAFVFALGVFSGHLEDLCEVLKETLKLGDN